MLKASFGLWLVVAVVCGLLKLFGRDTWARRILAMGIILSLLLVLGNLLLPKAVQRLITYVNNFTAEHFFGLRLLPEKVQPERQYIGFKTIIGVE